MRDAGLAEEGGGWPVGWRAKSTDNFKSNGNGNNDEESDARRWARSEKGSRLWRMLRCKARMMSSGEIGGRNGLRDPIRDVPPTEPAPISWTPPM
jgi:hypothetical protein